MKRMSEKAKRGIIVGRFQPYHLGHHEAVKAVLKEVDELIIAIGSTSESYERKNPFTTGERVEMASRALKADGLFGKCYIVPVPNINEYALWVNRVVSYVPHFDVVYTNNPLVKQLFESAGFEVRKMPSKLGGVESSAVREAIIKNKGWEKMLPEAVAGYLKELKIKERLDAIIAEEAKE